MIERTHRMVFYGRTGTGKSELARAIWTVFAPPRVVIDVKDDLADKLPGIPTVDSPVEVFAHPTVRAVPSRLDSAAWFDELYARALAEGGYVIWLDEANEISRPSFIPLQVRRYILQGRARRCGHLACTPRPADISPTFGAQANHVFVFRLTHPRDVAASAALLGVSERELKDAFEALPPYGYVYEDLTDPASAPVLMAPSHDPDELTAKLVRLYFGPAEIR